MQAGRYARAHRGVRTYRASCCPPSRRALACRRRSPSNLLIGPRSTRSSRHAPPSPRVTRARPSLATPTARVVSTVQSSQGAGRGSSVREAIGPLRQRRVVVAHQEHQAAARPRRDLHEVVGVQATLQDPRGDGRFHDTRQDLPHRPRAVQYVEAALLDEVVDGQLVQLEADAALALEASRRAAHQAARDLTNLVLLERQVHQAVLDARPHSSGASWRPGLRQDGVLGLLAGGVALVGAEAHRRARARSAPRLDVMMMIVSAKLTVRPRPSVRRPSSRICRKTCEHVAVRLLDLVEEDHLPRPASHGLGELAARLVAHVARRRADEASDAVGLGDTRRGRSESWPTRCRAGVLAMAFAVSVLPTPVGPSNRERALGPGGAKAGGVAADARRRCGRARRRGPPPRPPGAAPARAAGADRTAGFARSARRCARLRSRPRDRCPPLPRRARAAREPARSMSAMALSGRCRSGM
jgi:hypothetical protein